MNLSHLFFYAQKTNGKEKTMAEVAISFGIFSIVSMFVSKIDKYFKKETKLVSEICKVMFIVTGMLALI